MISDLFRLAVTNLMHRSLRSKLTILGIFIGIAAVVSLISVGQGLQMSINEQFENLGTNVLTVMPGGGFASAMGGLSTSKFTDEDLRVIQSVRGVKSAAGFQFTMGPVKFHDETKYTYVMGMDSDKATLELLQSTGVKILEGRELKSGDRYSAVVGYSFAHKEFFEKNVKIRDRLEIGGKDFRIVGIYDTVGNPQDDTYIYLPLGAYNEAFETSGEYAIIYVKVQDGFTNDEVKASIEKTLRRSRNVREGEEDFAVTSAEQLMEAFSTIFGVVQAVLVSIAAISLLVGGVGIMNSMYTSVLERTKDIGIMKAIGAKNSHIMILFLFESGLLGLIGGIFGVAVGVMFAKVAEIAAAGAGYGVLKTYISAELIIGSLLFSFILGTISGLLPARNAAKLNPVDALRYE
ncbi:MAG: ABC transporter permease [Candidatus Aenigmatarchaeota archaeon]